MTTTHLENAALPALYRLFDGISNGDLSIIPAVVTDDFVDHGSPVPLPPGPDGYAQILGFVTQVLDITYDPEEIFSTPDRIVVRAVAHGRGVESVHGASAAGKPYEMNTIHIYRTEGDRLAEHWGVRDELGVLVQLGVLPAPQLPIPAAS
jgi:predicted ester cyclase